MFKRCFIVIGLAVLTGILMLGTLAELANNTPVVGTTQALSAGQTITESDVALQPIHATAVSDCVITTLEEVVGEWLGQTRLTGKSAPANATRAAPGRPCCPTQPLEVPPIHNRP